MPSGVMAQSIALLIKAGARPDAEARFACHATSHLLVHEKDSYEHLLKQRAMTVGDAASPIAFADVEKALNGGEGERPHTLILEHPHREIGGQLTPHADLSRIAELCSSLNVAFHLDGAR